MQENYTNVLKSADRIMHNAMISSASEVKLSRPPLTKTLPLHEPRWGTDPGPIHLL